MRYWFSAIPSAMDFGADVLNPIQAPDAHMDPEGFEWDSGDAASLHGDIQPSLACGPPAQVPLELGRLLNRPGPLGRRTVSCYGSAREARGEQVVCFINASPELSDPHRYLTDQAGVTISHTPTSEPRRPHVSVRGLIAQVRDCPFDGRYSTPISRNKFAKVDPLQKFARYGVTLAYGGLTVEV